MATEVLIPKLGMTMTEGCVQQWKVPDGAHVEAGEIVYIVETEKIKFEVEAPAPGTVRQLVPEGSTQPVGKVIAYILAPGEALPEGAPVMEVSTGAATTAGSGTRRAAVGTARRENGRIFASPIARRLAREAQIDLALVAGTGPGGRVVEADVLEAKARGVQPAAVTRAAPAAPSAPAEPPLASPLARRLAEQHGIDLRRVRGSGPGGRITKEDVEQAIAAPRPAAAGPRPTPAADGAAGRPAVAAAHRAGEVIPLRGMRGVIAERMHASLQEMAQLTLGMAIEMGEAAKLRGQLVAEWADEGVRPSYTDLVIKAAAKALARHPLLNARITEAGIELLGEVHLGMAVALDDGLVVPVIRDADRLPLKEIAVESRRLSEAARAGRLLPDDYAGNTFTVTALGMFGVDFFTPIINPPNVAILGIGRVHDATAWEEDRPVRRQQMTLSLTIDHRAVDGAPAAAFLGTIKELLEAPYRLLI
jgi:pyruvate dehydrogenase E2 component (dihydrolipoamide acetyltransferase)